MAAAAEANTEEQLTRFKSDTVLKEIIKQQNMEIVESLEYKRTNLKESHKKLSTDLLRLVNKDFILSGQTKEELKKQMESLKQLRRSTTVKRSVYGATDNDMVYVYVYLDTPVGTHAIDSYAYEVTDRDEENQVAAAWVAINNLDTLASLDSVRAIQTVLPPVCNTGSVTSEGDSIHRANLVRSLGQDGTDMKIGIISDGVNNWRVARDSGNLPANLHVLSDTIGGDEGTAMLEIVHDLAPGAELYFHDHGANTIAFNSAIDDLIAAGCKIICDDIGWYGQPYFQDGSIARHIADKLAENDIIYISSAGNDAKNHYQGLFYDNGHDCHDFSSGTDSYDNLYIGILPGGYTNVFLQWDDDFSAPLNDYDLYIDLYDADAETIDYVETIYSVNDQSAGAPALEAIHWQNETGKLLLGIVSVNKYSGVAKNLEIFIHGYNEPDNIIAQDSIFGHPAVPGVIAVGAIDVPKQNQIAYYSSQGPVTIKKPNAQTRSKPDICGIANVSVTGAGGFSNPFAGTSAAAPHIAAIAALVWAENPNNNASEIRSALLTRAVDLGGTGYDYIYGYGRADAFNSYDMTPPAYQSAAIDGTKKKVTLTFSENLVANVTNLKGAVTYSTNAATFTALGDGDTVAISGNNLVVTFNTALTGASNKIRLAAGSLKDAANNVLAVQVTTDAITGFHAGDMNGDGLIDVLDLLWIASKIGPVTGDDVGKADINKDGQVNILDLLEVEQYVSKE